MLKRILLLLGETPSSVSARQYALRLARRADAEVTGLSGLDLNYIEAPTLGRIGASAYKVRLEQQLKQQAVDVRQRLHDAFELECRDHSVPFQWLSFEGDPIGTLFLASEARDLIVTGHDTAFCGRVHEPLSEVIAKLLLIAPRPVVICPDELSSADDILIAYDGSGPAARTVQLFALLGTGLGKRVHVTSIDVSQELAARRTAGVVSYLRSHGYDADANPIASRVAPAEVLKLEVGNWKVGTLVMGAYGHRGLREFLFGSTTTTLVEDPPCAVFLYH